MQSIDSYSYHCGFIDCVNEMLRAGVKTLALSRPMELAAERDALVPFARESCQRWGNQLYIEDDPLLTDLFPVSMNRHRYSDAGGGRGGGDLPVHPSAGEDNVSILGRGKGPSPFFWISSFSASGPPPLYHLKYRTALRKSPIS